MSDIDELRAAVEELHRVVQIVRENGRVTIPTPGITLPAESTGWNFATFERFINQRFIDLSTHLSERHENQQTSAMAALVAAEKAVNAALTSSEKAIGKSEHAQQLRNEAQNEFRKSLSDLSGLMWTTKEGTSALDAVRREFSQMHSRAIDRITALEGICSNMQGRIWAISTLWAVVVIGLSIAVKLIGHG